MDMLAVERLSQVLQHAVAPAFVLGAVAAFGAILLTRIENLLLRMRVLVALAQVEEAQVRPDQRTSAYPEQDVARLKRRVALLLRAVFLCLCSGITGTLLVMVAFMLGFLNVSHLYGMASLFLVTLGLLAAALVLFAKEVWIALKDYDQFG
jgi:hypothetical protein